MRKHFRSGVNIARARSFPGADIGSDHDVHMMTFHLRLKRINKPKHTRLKFDLEKLKDPYVLETFQAMIGGKFAPLTMMDNEDTDLDSMITILNTAVTETASEILGKQRQKKREEKKARVTADTLDLGKSRFESEGSVKHKEVNNNIKRCMIKAKENWIGEQCSKAGEWIGEQCSKTGEWIGEQCSKTGENLRENNSKRAYQLVIDLTTVKQGKTTTIKDCPGKCLKA